jgi:hypothetical protein
MDEERWWIVRINGKDMRTPPEHPFGIGREKGAALGVVRGLAIPSQRVRASVGVGIGTCLAAAFFEASKKR